MSSRHSSSKQSTRKAAPAVPRSSNATSVPNSGSSGGCQMNGSSGTTNAADSVDSRRLKKRELDRRCQRMARERTKQRIAYLEELVDNFRKQDASGQIANLMKQLTDAQKERDELTKTLKTIANSIRSHEILNSERTDEDIKDEINSDEVAVNRPLGLPSSVNVRRPSLTISDVHTTSPTGDDLPEVMLGSPPEAFNVEFPNDTHVSSDEEFVFEGDMASPQVLDHDPIYPKPSKGCDCTPISASPNTQLNLWRYACEALSERTKLSTEIMKIEDAYAEDIPVRAILDGWDAVLNFYGGTLPPLWQKLRTIDEIVFHGMNVKERLACLRVMHRLYRYHSDPTPERKKTLPQWYLKRPSQTLVHSYAIDFFAWPGVRERFVFAQHRYCSNSFWHLFNRCLHILWPYELRDCYSRNATTGQYSFSSSFDKRLFDINAWTMSDEIFQKWPEFYSDFPGYNRMPMTVSTKGLLQSHARKSLPSPSPTRQALPTPSTHRSTSTPADDSDSASVALPHTTIPFAAPLLPPSPVAPPLYAPPPFEDWWAAPLPFQQTAAPPPPPHQQTHQHQHQPQQQHGSAAPRDFAFQALGPRPDHLGGLYGLTF